MPDAICQTVTGSGDTVGAMLCLSVADGALKISDHLPSHPANGIQSDPTTDTPIAAALTPTTNGDGFISIATADLSNRSATPTLTLTLPKFISTGVAAGKAGNGVGHRSGVVN
jgi:hypothetical protein